MALSTTELCLAVQAEYGFKKILHWPVCACLNYTEKKKRLSHERDKSHMMHEKVLPDTGVIHILE